MPSPFAATPDTLETWKFVVTLATFVLSATAFVVSFLYLGRNYRNSVRSNSAKMVSDYSLKFNGADLRRQRREFAKQLLVVREEANKLSAGNHVVPPDLASRHGLGDDTPVLHFFEDVAYLTKLGVLESEMVWNSFVWHVERYYLALRAPHDILTELREPDYPAIFDRFEWLYYELIRIDRAERPTTPVIGTEVGSPKPPAEFGRDRHSPSEAQIAAFLEGEAKLDV